MRILVAWAAERSMNLGVRALACGSAELLTSVWPGAEIEYLDFGARPVEIPLGRPRSLIRERATGRLGMMSWLSRFDLLWDTRSGDSFTDIYGLERHAKMCLLHEFAIQAGVIAVMAPQTIGPFRTVQGRLLAARNLRRSKLVFARDPASATASAGLSRPVDATVTDVVFAIRQPVAPRRRDVVVNVSGLLWDSGNDHVDSEKYRRSVRTVIDRLLHSGRSITLLPHVLDSRQADNDVPVSRLLCDEYAGRVDLRIPRDLHDARDVLAGAAVVIGARMHACLNALSTGTPAIAMAYSRKFAPLLTELNWPYVVDLRDSADPAGEVLSAVADSSLHERAVAARDHADALMQSLVPLLRDVR